MTVKPIEVDLWLRGTTHATTRTISSVPRDSRGWTDGDVRHLLSEMLLALDREKNPGRDAQPVHLRGFNWIVSPYENGVLLHIELQLGTATAGPFAIEEARLTGMIQRVLATPSEPSTIH